MPDLAARSLVPKGMVRMAPTMALPALLRDHGVDPVPLLREFGLELTQFDEPDDTLSFADRSRLLARCAEAARCPHFGLLVGQTNGLASFGVLGYLMQSAPDLRTALAIAVRHFPLHNPNSASALVERDGRAVFSHTILDPGVEGREQVLDLSLGIMMNAMRSLCGHELRPIEVRLARARPRNVKPYTALVQAPLVFDALETAVIIPALWLDRPLRTADPLLHLFMQHRMDDLEAQSGEDVASQLRRMLPALVDSGNATLADAARRLGLGVRTLNRRLAVEGTSYAKLKDEARQSLARQLLLGTTLPIGRIAEHLGYAHAGAFTQAFRRWSGMGPAQWRARGHAVQVAAGTD